jgi:hypothetical protein
MVPQIQGASVLALGASVFALARPGSQHLGELVYSTEELATSTPLPRFRVEPSRCTNVSLGKTRAWVRREKWVCQAIGQTIYIHIHMYVFAVCLVWK